MQVAPLSAVVEAAGKTIILRKDGMRTPWNISPQWTHAPGEPVPTHLASFVSTETWTAFLEDVLKSDQDLSDGEIAYINVYLLVLVLGIANAITGLVSLSNGDVGVAVIVQFLLVSLSNGDVGVAVIVQLLACFVCGGTGVAMNIHSTMALTASRRKFMVKLTNVVLKWGPSFHPCVLSAQSIDELSADQRTLEHNFVQVSTPATPAQDGSIKMAMVSATVVVPESTSTSGGGSSVAERIKELDNLKNQGILTEDEYNAQRKAVISTI